MPLGILTSLAVFEDMARDLGQNRRALILGARGGVGVYAVQLARTLGYQVDVVDAQEYAEFLFSLGADHVLDQGKGTYDFVFDLTTQYSWEDCKKLLTPTGKFVPALPDDSNGGTRNDSQVGYLMLTHGDGPRLEDWGAKVTQKDIVPIIDSVFTFDNYQEGLNRLSERGKKGRIVLVWDADDLL